MVSRRSKRDSGRDAETIPKRGKLPPKGTAARLAVASGLWSHLSPEEVSRIKQEIFGSRRSAK
ncbi:MAG: hypothetical protein Q7T82_12565 [Armatimonadota bacterium]|nr:hypothetical protein [Armatimonadota bacterium]